MDAGGFVRGTRRLFGLRRGSAHEVVIRPGGTMGLKEHQVWPAMTVGEEAKKGV